MPNPNELAQLVSSFAASLDRIVDERVAAELNRRGLPAEGAARSPAPRPRPPAPLKKVKPVLTTGWLGKPPTEAELRAQCRVPGCPTPNSGPRMHLFCRQHFETLTDADRERYKAIWKAAQAGA